MEQDRLRAVLVDDEEHCVETLKWQLEQYCPEVMIQKVFNKPSECLKYLLYNRIDLLFLDIEMPVLNGFDLLNALPTTDFALVFTTAYDEFAIKAIKHHAIDYLLKPIDKNELQKSVQTAIQNKNNLDIRISELMKDMDVSSDQKITIPTIHGFEVININDIVHCVSESNYTHIHIESGEKYLVSRTLKEIESQIEDENFIRVHQSHLVNTRFVKKYIKGSNGVLILNDDTEVPVSRRKKTELTDRIS